MRLVFQSQFAGILSSFAHSLGSIGGDRGGIPTQTVASRCRLGLGVGVSAPYLVPWGVVGGHGSGTAFTPDFPSPQCGGVFLFFCRFFFGGFAFCGFTLYLGQLFFQLCAANTEDYLKELMEKYHLGGCRYNGMPGAKVLAQNRILQKYAKVPVFIAC